MFIPDPGSWFLSRVPDTGSQIPLNYSTKRGGNCFLVLPFFFSHKYHKIVNNFIFEQVKNIFIAKTLRVKVFFTQKVVIKLFKKYGFGIRDRRTWHPGSKKSQHHWFCCTKFLWGSTEKPRFLLLRKQPIKKNKEPECEWCFPKAPSRRSPIPRAIAAPPQSHWTAGRELCRGPDGRWTGVGGRKGWRAGRRRRRDRSCSVVEP
jgi:hypothetical protein